MEGASWCALAVLGPAEMSVHDWKVTQVIWCPFPVGCESAAIQSSCSWVGWMKWGQARTKSGWMVLERWAVQVTVGSVIGWSVCEVKAGVQGSVTRETVGSAVAGRD